ncbi:TIGR02611 family protein [Leucobacter massiliensis]|uniref:TIGR02611 family protein n=1 Tax=Leucobacter massiliensis TaxID=1686285 RepID=A0A2S9QNV4_9MICO|nr:TIGR02611 family protein [Leucobacter massiliensis]PRI11263.1 TIGR02611 family protein [Leucobacter massiliensis]
MSDPYAGDAERARRLGRGFGRFAERWRAVIRRRPWLDSAYRVLVTVLGALVVVLGLVLVPLPGPGWLVVFLGLTILGTEHHWARRLLGWLRRALAAFWERWNRWRSARRARGAERRARRAVRERRAPSGRRSGGYAPER